MTRFVTIGLIAAFWPCVGHACDRVEYAEAKTWSTQKLERAYCKDVDYSLARLEAQLDGQMGYTASDAELCRQQIAIYKRLLEARGQGAPKTCK